MGSPLARQGSAPVLSCSKRALEQRLAASRSSRLWLSPGSGNQVSSTAMQFWVIVPVLSEQITLTDPRVSTADRRRTKALRRAMRCTLSARVSVTCGSRPSGTKPTMMPTA